MRTSARVLAIDRERADERRIGTRPDQSARRVLAGEAQDCRRVRGGRPPDRGCLRPVDGRASASDRVPYPGHRGLRDCYMFGGLPAFVTGFVASPSLGRQRLGWRGIVLPIIGGLVSLPIPYAFGPSLIGMNC